MFEKIRGMLGDQPGSRLPKSRTAKGRTASWIAGISPLILFLLLYFPNIRCLGFSSEDIDTVYQAWRIEHHIGNCLFHDFSRQCWAGIPFPLMRTRDAQDPFDPFPHHGPMLYYLAAPFVFFFGHTPSALYWFGAFFGCLFLWALYRLGVSLYRDDFAASLACLFVAASPSFLFYSLTPSYSMIPPISLALAGLHLFLLYADRPKPFLAYWAMACLGCALAASSHIAGSVVGMIGAAFIFRAPIAMLLPAQAVQKRRFLLLCLAFFAVPLFTIAIFTLRHMPESIQFWTNPFAQSMHAGFQQAYRDHFGLRLEQLSTLFGIVDETSFFVYDRGEYLALTRWNWPLVLCGLGGALACLISQWKIGPRRWKLPWVIAAGFLLVSPFSPTELLPNQLLGLMPILWLCIVLPVAAAFRSKWRTPVAAVFSVVLICWMRMDWMVLRSFHSEIEQSGGSAPFYVRANLDVYRYFSQRPDTIPVLLGQTTIANLFKYLSGDRTRCRFIAKNYPRSRGIDDHRWGEILAMKRAFFVADDPSFGARHAWKNPLLAVLNREADERNRRVALVDTVKRPDGEPVYGIYRIAP